MGIYVVSGICGLIGLAFFLYVLKRLFDTFTFINGANKALGKVVSFANARTSDHHLTYLPIFEFRTGDGQIFHYTGTVASNPPAYQIGETKEILFLKKNPKEAKINSFSELWLTTLILALISFILFVFSLLLFFSSR